MKILSAILAHHAIALCLGMLTTASSATVPVDNSKSPVFNLRRLELPAEPAIVKSPAYGEERGYAFDDVDFFDQTKNQEIAKIREIEVRTHIYSAAGVSARTVRYIKVTYQLRDGSTETVKYGDEHVQDEKPITETIDFSNRVLTGLELRISDGPLSSRWLLVTQLTFYTSDGRKFGPYGDDEYSKELVSINRPSNSSNSDFKQNRAIVAFFGRAGGYLHQLGVYMQDHAIERIVINGPPEFTELAVANASVETFEGSFDNALSSKLTFNNCASTQAQTSTLTFTGTTTNTQSYSVSTARQDNTELSISASVTAGVGFKIFSAEATVSTSLTVGTSWTAAQEFGQQVSKSEEIELSLAVSAKGGSKVVGSAVLRRVNYRIDYQAPVLVYYVGNPEPEEATIEGVYEGSQGYDAQIVSEEQSCEPTAPAGKTSTGARAPPTEALPSSSSTTDNGPTEALLSSSSTTDNGPTEALLSSSSMTFFPHWVLVVSFLAITLGSIL